RRAVSRRLRRYTSSSKCFSSRVIARESGRWLLDAPLLHRFCGDDKSVIRLFTGESQKPPTSREGIMRQAITVAFIAAALLAPTAAGAGERMFDGALGAGSGALVGGPVGFVAGGVVGFVAGPHISRGLGFHRTIAAAITVAAPLPPAM